jgi:hypothetical protein
LQVVICSAVKAAKLMLPSHAFRRCIQQLLKIQPPLLPDFSLQREIVMQFASDYRNAEGFYFAVFCIVYLLPDPFCLSFIALAIQTLRCLPDNWIQAVKKF